VSEISVWYVSNLQRCNFTCSYCASSQPTRQQDPRLPTWTLGQNVHDRIVAWLGQQDLRLRLRMNSIGEPFASREYLDSVARLTRSRNLSMVEILSNGSFRHQQFDRFAADCDLEKLSLWITFHHEFISPRTLVDAAGHARSRGASVVVNAIVFPDNVAAVGELLQLCGELELPIATGLGLNFNNAYPDQGFTPATHLPAPRALELANQANPLGQWHELSAAPVGKPCAAGGSYFYVHPNGDVFACRTYAAGKRERRLGSALDEQFRLEPRPERYHACRAAGRCGCPEDYQNLEAIQSRFTWPERSFCLAGASEPAPGPAPNVGRYAPARARTHLPVISDAP
jgi:MoaA/NifB/PqqE/SkfB family radical SAM enzyme